MKKWLAVCFLLLLTACGKDEVYLQESYVFGTRVQISIWGLPDEVAAKHAGAVLSELDRLHARLHAWQPSPVTRMNAAFAKGEAAQIDAELMQMLKTAQDLSRASDRLFNPAIGKLITLWGFHRDNYEAVLPDPAQITALLAAQPSLDDLEFDGPLVKSRNRQVEVDLGGFAKGWALDHSAAYLRKNRVFNALINIGGNVMALGKKGDQPWVVGIQHPREPKAMATIALRDGEAIGTSGDYQRYFMKDGVRYSHLIDPRTGRPSEAMQAATLLVAPAENAGTLSDAMSKPVFLGGVAQAMAHAERFGVRNVLLVANDGSVHVSSQMQARLKWLHEPPHLYRLR